MWGVSGKEQWFQSVFRIKSELIFYMSRIKPVSKKQLSSGFLDREAPSLIPPITCRLEAWCKCRIKIHPVINPLHYGIFLAGTVSFHNPGSALVQKRVMPGRE